MKPSPVIPRPQTTPSTSEGVHSLPHKRNLIATLQILTATTLGMAALLSFLPAAGHDQLWFLLMAHRWLAGATLYGPSLFDSNPPLIVWLSAIPVSLGEHLHLSIPAIGKFLVLLAEAASASLSLAFLRRLVPAITRAQLLWLAFAFVCIFAVTPARDLGQRDHLTAILCLPYVLAAAVDDPDPSTSGRGFFSKRRELLLRALAGLLAAIGICLKPHQALIPIAVELTRLFLRIRATQSQTRPPTTSTASHLSNPVLSTGPRAKPRGNGETPAPAQIWTSLLRPEPPLLLLSGLLFLAAIRHFTPAYFTLALPTLRDTYWAIGHLTPFELLDQSPQLHVLAVITLTIFVLRRNSAHPSPLRPAIALLLAAGLAATLAYFLQGTGWYYQQLPAISLFASALALQLLDLPVLDLPAPLHPPNSPWLPRAALALSLLALTLTTYFTGYPLTPHLSLDRSPTIASPDPASPDPTFFDHLAPGTPVAMITTSVDDTMMPTARFHLLWAQRTNNVWTLPAILRTEDPQNGSPPPHPPTHTIPPARLAELDRQQHAWMVEDLHRWQPQLILVARCQSPEVHCQELEDRHDNLLAWFRRDPAFEQIWQHFHYLRMAGNYDAYIRN